MLKPIGLSILCLLPIAGCAPAPLYSASGIHKGAVTFGEIPRDSRGEPVWAAIRPTPVTPTQEAAPPTPPAPVQEGDAAEAPMPPKA